MKLEHQFASTAQCKRLKELGIVQEGQFSWIYSHFKDDYELSHRQVESLELSAAANPKNLFLKEKVEKGIFSAWAVPELSELLPYYLRDWENKENPHLRVYRGEQVWSVEYHTTFSAPYKKSIRSKYMAEAMADILIKLLESKTITPEDCNKRLKEA